MKRSPSKPVCAARSSRTGRPCQKPPIKGGTVCRTHGGSAPQVRRKAAERLADLIDPARALREAARLAYSDIRELFDDAGRILPIRDWPDDIAAAVSSIEVVRRNLTVGDGTQEQVHKIRLWDKGPNLGLLFRHLGLLDGKPDEERREPQKLVILIQRAPAGAASQAAPAGQIVSSTRSISAPAVRR